MDDAIHPNQPDQTLPSEFSEDLNPSVDRQSNSSRASTLPETKQGNEDVFGSLLSLIKWDQKRIALIDFEHEQQISSVRRMHAQELARKDAMIEDHIRYQAWVERYINASLTEALSERAISKNTPSYRTHKYLVRTSLQLLRTMKLELDPKKFKDYDKRDGRMPTDFGVARWLRTEGRLARFAGNVKARQERLGQRRLRYVLSR